MTSFANLRTANFESFRPLRPGPSALIPCRLRRLQSDKSTDRTTVSKGIYFYFKGLQGDAQPAPHGDASRRLTGITDVARSQSRRLRSFS